MKAVSRDTVNAQTYATLKQAIMSAQFRPGEPLTLRALAATLGTSDMPVREALRQLVAERAVEARPNHTPRIPVLSVQRMREIIELRTILEGHAAGLAALHITERELKSVEAEHAAADAALLRADLKVYLKHNTRLHFLIYHAAQMATIIPFIESLWLQFAPTFSVSISRLTDDRETLARVGHNHHSDIVRALKSRNREMAKRELQADILAPTQVKGFWDSVGAPEETASDKPARRKAR